MSSAAEKILAILKELEPAAEAKGRSAQEIAKILLGESAAQPQTKQTVLPPTEPNGVKQTQLIDSFSMEVARSAANDAWQLRYYREIYSCRPGIGKLIVFGKRLVRKLLKFLIEPITEDQTRFNSAAVNTLNAMRNNDMVFEAHILQLHQVLEQDRNEMEQVRSALKQNQAELEQVQSALKQNQAELEQVRSALKQNQAELEQTRSALKQNQAELEQTRETVAEQEAALCQIREQLSRERIYENLDYADFEDCFRGDRAEIKERQRSYLPYFENCSRVVDLGCGRGEFLELLKENGVSAVGVDGYRPFAEDCTTRGLEVIERDAVEYLKTLENGSLDGIAAFQLVEHMSIDAVIALCEESHRVLQPGKKLVLETPNPTCLSTYMNSFYLDPSHNKPLHPRTVEYFLKKAGFRKIQVVFTEESKTDYRLPLLDAEGKDLARFNDGVNFVSDILFGSQDYAIIAEK